MYRNSNDAYNLLYQKMSDCCHRSFNLVRFSDFHVNVLKTKCESLNVLKTVIIKVNCTKSG